MSVSATDIQISSACTGAVAPDHMTNGEEPSAPPAYPIDEISGYEGTALGDGAFLVFQKMQPKTAKEALIQYAASKCCYSSAPAKEMVFRNLQPFNTYRGCDNCRCSGTVSCTTCHGNGKVYPVVNFPDPSISQASQNAVVQHHTQFASTSRVLRQRQTIELIPLTKVEYEWQGEQYSYYVYGEENRVYAENYPKKCCCCSVM
ncbi:Putative protein C3orf32 [Chelonia mydas]|uniref:Uncharacterized protein n=1 Tax=Chelonia mydas TaxID=8469 RepID=M7C1W8_CHEMY|nr:Putative protein C3orf32 [Chelonia mydas]